VLRQLAQLAGGALPVYQHGKPAAHGGEGMRRW
jgi:hypothetical protein